MKRVQVTEEELAILEGLRHERAIWNQALEAALATLTQVEFFNTVQREDAVRRILELRK